MSRTAVLGGLAAALLLPAAGQLLWAQGVQPTTGVIEGRVEDRSGVPIADAAVLISGASERTVRTDRGGFYRSDQLVLGVYSVEAQAEGYVTSLFEGMRLRPGETLRLDFRLAEGSPTSFAMTRMPVVDTRSRGARYWLTREDLERLPSAGVARSLLSLLPRSEVVLVDEAELAVPRTESAGTLGLSLERLPPEMLNSVTVSSAEGAPAQRSSERLQLLTRSSQAPLHGSLIVRLSDDRLQGSEREGLPTLQSSARPTAALGGVPHERYRLFGAWSGHRERSSLELDPTSPLEIGGELLGIERADRTSIGRLDFGPPERWELRLLWLETDADVEASAVDLQPGRVDFFSKARRQLLGAALERVTEERVGYTLALREDEIALESALSSDPLREQRSRLNRELSWLAEVHRGSHLIALSAGLLDSELRSGVRRDRLDSFALGLEDRWSLDRRWVVYWGLRAQRLRQAPQGGLAAIESTVVDPRLSLAFDYGGDGQLGFRLSAGRERSPPPTFLDAVPSDAGIPEVRDPDRLQPAVEYLSLGARYQLVPGLTFEGELSRRERDLARNAGDEARRLALIDPLAGLVAGSFSAVSELRLDEFFAQESRFRFQTEARIGPKFTSWALYELRDFEQGRGLDDVPIELGTVQHLRITSAYRFQNGIGFGGVFRYVDGYGVATPRVGTLVLGGEAPLSALTSLAQTDLSFDFRPQIADLGLLGAIDLVLRLEVLNVFDRANRPVSAAALDGTGEASGLALVQEPRAVWLGMGLEF